MNLHLKIKLYENQGYSLETARVKVIDEAERKLKHMDQLLATCIKHLPADKVTEIFGELK